MLILPDKYLKHFVEWLSLTRQFASITYWAWRFLNIDISQDSVSTRLRCGKCSPYSITERRVSDLIPVLGSQPAGDVTHKPGGRLPLVSARPAVTPATLKRAATNFAAWWTETQWVWTVCLRLLPDSVATAICTRAFCAWVQHANHSATEPPLRCGRIFKYVFTKNLLLNLTVKSRLTFGDVTGKSIVSCFWLTVYYDLTHEKRVSCVACFWIKALCYGSIAYTRSNCAIAARSGGFQCITDVCGVDTKPMLNFWPPL